MTMSISLFKKAATTLMLSLAVSSAQAAPQLRGDVIVNSAIVTIGDIFDNAGLMAETPVFRAPAPGTAGVLDLDTIVQAVQGAGLNDFDATGIDRVRIARAGVPVDMPLIADIIADDLKARGILNAAMDMQLALDRPLPEIMAGDLDNPASLVILRYLPGSSTFSARFQIAGLDTPLDVSGQIQFMVETPHLSRSLPAGTILGANDFEMRKVPLTYAENTGIVAIEDLVGKQLQRQIRQGVMIRPNDIAAPELISRNEHVTIIYRQGALTLTTRGQALNAASMSQPVNVLNPMTKKVLQGTAIENGVVLVTGGNQQVAGLE